MTKNEKISAPLKRTYATRRKLARQAKLSRMRWEKRKAQREVPPCR